MVIPPVEGNQRSTLAADSARQVASAKLFAVGTPSSDQLPDMPPAEVLDALDTAARVLNELDRKQISIRLEHDAWLEDCPRAHHERRWVRARARLRQAPERPRW